MAYTTEAAVQSIMPEYPDVLTPFLADAALLVSEELVGKGLSTARLEVIERYLAAHFASIFTPLIKTEEVGPLSTSFERGKTMAGLQSTQYGQQAISWDTTGTLKALSDGFRGSAGMTTTLEPWQTAQQEE